MNFWKRGAGWVCKDWAINAESGNGYSPIYPGQAQPVVSFLFWNYWNKLRSAFDIAT
jgi:hypothetical protein